MCKEGSWCWSLETKQDGKFRNKLYKRRCLAGAIGFTLVVLIGFAIGAMMVKLAGRNTPEEVYKRLAEADGHVTKNTSSCNNIDKIKMRYKDQWVFRCKAGNCVPIHQRCDGFFNCGDKSDEDGCASVCAETVAANLAFSCTATNRTVRLEKNNSRPGAECFPMSYKCDGHKDCPEDKLTDENLCAEPKFSFGKNNNTELAECSGMNRFLCLDKEFCISRLYVCDQFPDCLDGSDEGKFCDAMTQ